MNKKDISKITFNWYPLRTKFKHEKTAFKNLSKAGYEVYLPLTKSIRKWSDRKKIIEVPLIPTYIFAYLSYNQLHKVLDLPWVTRYITFNGKPATIREKDILLMKKALDANTEIEIIDGIIEEGTTIKLISGPFNGYEGKVLDYKSKKNIVIQLGDIQKSLLITVEKSAIQIENNAK